MKVDLLDGEWYASGGAEGYAWLRQKPGLWFDEANRLWAVARHADVLEASRSPERFCNGKGYRPRYEGDQSMIGQDDPRHNRQRRLVSKGFTPKQVAGMEAHCRQIVTELLDEVGPKGECDFVQDLAVPLPMIVIAELLGVRVEDRDRLQRWSDELIKAADGDIGEGTVQEYVDFSDYITEVIEARRVDPKDDLTSILVHATIDGEVGFDLAGLISELLLIMIGGNETTRNVISGSMEALCAHPEQRKALVDDPSMLPTAIEEFLRWVTPIVNFQRTVVHDTELAGTPLKTDDKLLLLYGSANRDEAVFGPTAPEFDIRRDPNPHVAFGFGTHFCLGASLARLEIRVMYEELLRRLPDIELDGPVERVPNTFIRGIASMPVRFTPERN